MEKCLLANPPLSEHAIVPGRLGLRLLLVSSNVAWHRAVHSAAWSLGGGNVDTCDARSAVCRLAGTGSDYSHLLVDRNDAQGLLVELANLTTEIAGPDTHMLLLDSGASWHPFLRVVPDATPQSITDALMRTLPPRDRPGMNLTELTAAMQSQMIETRYQPIIRIADRQPIGLEALARLNHPERGTLLPDFFVPQIEDAGLAAELTSAVSERAFADLAGPLLAGRGLRMSLNFPLDVLLRPAALDRLEEQRIAAGLTADQIAIELTESQPVQDIPALRRSLERLRGLGYGAAIDDVGPAVPRLAPLLELPFTSLKLDKDLVRQVEACPDIRRFLTETIIQAKRHGLTVVAEGVETVTIWDRMTSLGCDEIQGFLAARPLSVAAVPVWWDAWRLQNMI